MACKLWNTAFQTFGRIKKRTVCERAARIEPRHGGFHCTFRAEDIHPKTGFNNSHFFNILCLLPTFRRLHRQNPAVAALCNGQYTEAQAAALLGPEPSDFSAGAEILTPAAGSLTPATGPFEKRPSQPEAGSASPSLACKLRRSTKAVCGRWVRRNRDGCPAGGTRKPAPRLRPGRVRRG